jgi:molybdopterin molybdotransferase
MNHFFNVKTLEEVFSLVPQFPALSMETIDVTDACSIILAVDVVAGRDMPGFRRATMDG